MTSREFWSSLGSDAVFALRQARRQRLSTAIALVTFALGIGANTAIFSVVRGVLLRPLPYASPERLAAIWPNRAISNAELLYLQRESRTVDRVAAISLGWGVALTGAGEPRQLDAARVSTNFFEVLGTRPILGRTFRPGESEHGHWDVVVLSHALWMSQFGGDSAVLGRVVDMDGVPHRIVGVMPADFEIFQSGVEAWLPLQIDPSSPYYTGAIAVGFGRLAPGATFASATSELATLAPRMRDAFHYADDYARGAVVIGLHESLVGDVRRSLLVLQGAVLLLVLIAVANVGNLMLAQAVVRGRELAVRRALGASRARIVRQLLVQCLLLSLAGGLVGVLAGIAGTRALKALLPPTLPRLATVAVDPAVLAVCLALIVIAGIAFGLAPAALAGRVDPEGVLRAGSAGASGRGSGTMRELLIVAEVALSVVLVVGAALMLDTLWQLRNVDLGFQPRGVLTFRIQPTSGQIASPERTTGYFDEITRRLAAIPGVRHVGAAQHLPLSGFNWRGDLQIESHPIPPTATHPSVVWRSVVGDYFGAMSIPLLRGRLFEATDSRDGPRVVVVGATMARHFWPNSDPIGARIRLGHATDGKWATIVGIVGDVRSRAPNEPPTDELYLPNAQAGLQFMHYVVRTDGDPLAFVPLVRAAIRSIDQTVPIAEVRSLGDLYSTSTATSRTLARLLAAFAILGVILGAVGIYGVVSYTVGQRTRELGIRTALGALERRITWMIVGEGLRTTAVGIVIGTAGAALAARALRTLVFGVATSDPSIYGTVIATLLLIAAAAAYVPARRAARVDPLVALRSE